MNIFETLRQFLGLSDERRQRRIDHACLNKVTSATEKALDQGKIRSAVEQYQEAVAAIPHHGQFLHYNVACILDRYAGDGTEARSHYMAALAVKPNDKIVPRESVEAVTACCYENLMLLALSYDEYDNWAAKLRALRPNEPILSGQWPLVKTRRDKGEPWWETLFGFSDAFCNFVEPARDQRLYGKAASLYSLILDNIASLRVPLGAYRSVGGVYGAAVGNLCCQHLSAAEQYGIILDPWEMSVVLDKAIPRIEQYLRTFPNETKIVECLGMLRGYLQPANTAVQEPAASQLTHPDHYEKTMQKAPGKKCRLRLIHADAESARVTLVYKWDMDLDSDEADKVDTRARAYVACAIYDAARRAGLMCQPGPLHGQRPAWLFAGENIPVSLVKADFDVSDKTCFMQVGSVMVRLDEQHQSSPSYGKKLIAGFRSQFSEINV